MSVTNEIECYCDISRSLAERTAAYAAIRDSVRSLHILPNSSLKERCQC